MTTQAIKATLISPGFSCGLELTATDDQWNELLDNVDGLSLFKVAQGRVFNQISAYYTAGGAICRIRNLKTSAVKMIEGMTMPKGVHSKPFDYGPVTIQDGDILEVFCTVAGS